MQAVDAAAIDRLGIPRLLLMEHAGLAVARVVRRWVGPPPRSVAVCSGLGYNGGDGLCAARHLSQWGYRVRVWLAGRASDLREEPAVYARILRRLDVPIADAGSRQGVSWNGCRAVIDALLGIGLHGLVRAPYARMIERINQAGAPVIAADIPSGLDADTGRRCGIAVRADATVTFGRPKQGLFLAEGPAHAGRIIVDSITVPPSLLMP